MKTRHRLLLWMIVIAVVATAVAGSGAVWLMHRAVGDQFTDRVRAETALLADQWADGVGEDPQAFAEKAAGRLQLRVTLIDHRGTVVGDSARDAAGLARMDNHGNRPEIVTAGRAGSGEGLRRSDTTGVEYYYSACRVDGSRGEIRFIRLALPSAHVARVQQRYALATGGLLLLALLPLVVLGYWAIRRLGRPLERVTASTERAAAGDLEPAAVVDGGEEVLRLAAAIEDLKARTRRRIGDLSGERTLLASVISDMREGLLLVDADYQVQLANRAARKLFRLDFDPVGHRLTDVVRHPTVLAQVQTTLDGVAELGNVVVELDGTGRSFELRVTRLEERQAALVLLFDVTRLEALERVRREFVANVSHELRTPLTSIKAFTETLLDGGLDDREHADEFLQIIAQHTGRMEALIQDLTDLSLIETGVIVMRPEEIDLGRLVDEVFGRLSARALAERVGLIADLPQAFQVVGDRQRLDQILTNLIENAIKFNRPEGEVRVRGSYNGNRALIEVVDTGQGIPSDQLELIFNRFHRVSKVRSPRVQGTGLGLSIVKHLARLHGGQVHVESEVGQGTTFTVELPIGEGS